MAAAKPRIKVPKSASAGDIVNIKTLVKHPMHSGLAKDKDGNVIPRQIINRFACEFNGQSVFSADIDPGIASNPYFEFKAKVNESGTFKFIWTDDDGSIIEAERKIEVS